MKIATIAQLFVAYKQLFSGLGAKKDWQFSFALLLRSDQ